MDHVELPFVKMSPDSVILTKATERNQLHWIFIVLPIV